MPEECKPMEGKKRGQLSYTIENAKTGAKIEVLLKGKAFRIVRIAVLKPTGALVRTYVFLFVSPKKES